MEASGTFSVGVIMQTCAVECYKAMFQSSVLLYTGEKANQRLVLCVLALFSGSCVWAERKEPGTHCCACSVLPGFLEKPIKKAWKI